MSEIMGALPREIEEAALRRLSPMPRSLDQIGALMLEITREWRYELDRRLKPLGLSQVRWWTLLEVSFSDEPMNQNELAQRLSVEGPTMARLLDRLQGEGLILRNEDTTDRRRKLITLTDKAVELLHSVERVTREVRLAYLDGIDRARLQDCMDVLADLRTNQRAVGVSRGGPRES